MSLERYDRRRYGRDDLERLAREFPLVLVEHYMMIVEDTDAELATMRAELDAVTLRGIGLALAALGAGFLIGLAL